MVGLTGTSSTGHAVAVHRSYKGARAGVGHGSFCRRSARACEWDASNTAVTEILLLASPVDVVIPLAIGSLLIHTLEGYHLISSYQVPSGQIYKSLHEEN